ncbi:hypothetical protein AB6A40_007793 [Gnathostoma spinigerum]|uniref:Uncharacterized protein n=1 Tax=Gnathostoma spinigerum TaxID=75299 RepID=A0ABD6ESF7_9BILA
MSQSESFISMSEFGSQLNVITLQHFVLSEQKKHPEATGDLTALLTSLLTAIKAISSIAQRNGLVKMFVTLSYTNFDTYGNNISKSRETVFGKDGMIKWAYYNRIQI